MKRRTLLDRICTPEFAVGVARARTALDKTDAAYARGRRAGLEEAASEIAQEFKRQIDVMWPLSEEELAELERAERAGTSGPWATDDRPLGGGCVSAKIGGVERQVAVATGQAAAYDPAGRDVVVVQAANALLIAAARNALPRLLSEVRRARKEPKP